MKVYLAGYNVDATVLEELQRKSGKREDVTPEVISAAYARISRDPRPINEIRKDARREVERARKSNRTIIFKMGHHSVAEHAVFNLDIIGVSRLAMEEVEKFRLCSYTEKSQRYITLDKGFVVPHEIEDTPFKKAFLDLLGEQIATYKYLFDKLKRYVFKKYARLAENPKNHSLLEGWAKEDARYITSLATESQVGLTINARNLELMLRRFASHSLYEIKQLGRAIYNEIYEVAPSIVIFHEANERDKNTYPQLRKLASNIIDFWEKKDDGEVVSLVEYTPDGDDIIAASLLHTSSGLPYRKCKSIVKDLLPEKKEEIFKKAWENMQFYDSMLREFEYVNLTFDIIISSACFGQLKRHRMTTLTTQDYNPELGVTVPQSVKEIDEEDRFRKVIDKANELYYKVKKEFPLAAPYVLTNAHRRRVLLRLNARELYHISRLREDSHAQWDIRNISSIMSRKAKEVMPLVFKMVGPKDKYNEIYQSIFGRLPRVTKSVLPGERKIKP